MIRYKTNRQALIIAVIVILLCLVSLMGATYALFMETAENGTIGVITTAGDIKVDIVNALDEQDSLVGEVLQFQTSDTQRDILFEPGATFYTQGFKIKNTGDIPINFRLYISEDEKIDMEEFNRAFDVWISTSKTNTADAKKITEFTDYLEVGCSSEATYYLFIKMKENVGNEFQGKTYTGIGVTVYAVQGNVEAKEQTNE